MESLYKEEWNDTNPNVRHGNSDKWKDLTKKNGMILTQIVAVDYGRYGFQSGFFPVRFDGSDCWVGSVYTSGTHVRKVTGPISYPGSECNEN
ncbi:hypothetical protein U1Q18_030047 [Sarracenia purpurea var. burkii]